MQWPLKYNASLYIQNSTASLFTSRWMTKYKNLETHSCFKSTEPLSFTTDTNMQIQEIKKLYWKHMHSTIWLALIFNLIFYFFLCRVASVIVQLLSCIVTLRLFWNFLLSCIFNGSFVLSACMHASVVPVFLGAYWWIKITNGIFNINRLHCAYMYVS